MIRLRQTAGWLVAVVMTGPCALALLAAPITNVPTRLFSTPTNIIPPMPQARSPVDLFRELLAMTPADREKALTNRPPLLRARIEAKLNEYAVLDPDERELRLRATELRWYLLPLLREAPTNRAVRLQAVPEALQPLVKSRLMQWDILPPPLQKEFLDSERSLRYFAHVDLSPNSAPPPLPQNAARPPAPGDAGTGDWNALSEDQRRQISAQFNQFFELTSGEKQKALNTLSEPERRQMEKTLDSFGRLAPAQRLKCIRAFGEFAGMSPAEKQDFLKNARRWSQMSPRERQAWRDLVAHVPQWPPLPPGLMPPLPPPLPPLSQRVVPIVATNPN